MKLKVSICEKTKKVSLSESAAMRKLNSYDAIKSYYYCKHCSKYHITSKGSSQKFQILKHNLVFFGMDLSKNQMKQTLYNYKDGELPITKKIDYCLDNMYEFAAFSREFNKGYKKKGPPK